MTAMNHAIATVRTPRPASQRMLGFAIALLLNTALIAALVVGLRSTILRPPVEPPATVYPHDKIVDPLPPKPPTGIRIVETFDGPRAVPPVVKIDNGETGGAITTNASGGNQPAVFSSALGIVATHTTPPYPPVALRLGEAGTVRLHLTISSDGGVLAATVVRSSGYADLDRAAAEWVKSHWRYRPATRGGAAVESALDAEILFDLKNAR